MATDINIAVFHAARQTTLGDMLSSELVNITASSLASSALGASEVIPLTARLQPDTACWVAWGQNPTAVNAGSLGSSMRMNAGSTEYIGIQPGDKIAVIALA